MNYNTQCKSPSPRDPLWVSLLVLLVGLLLMVALNAMMLFYHYDVWTNPRYGAYSVFRKYFEVSGFDPFSYIIVTTWRPLYVLERHPLLAVLLWPLSQLNGWLKDVTGINCAIYVVGAVWALVSLCSWWLMYRILRRLSRMTWPVSLLLTLFFFSFAYVMLTIFTPDHMTLSLPLLLLAIYLSGRAMQRGGAMPWWQSLPLAFVATGVTTTNIVKVWLADIATQWGQRARWRGIVRRSMLYLIPAALIVGAYCWQQETVMVREKAYADNVVRERAKRDTLFAQRVERQRMLGEQTRKKQLVHSDLFLHTEYLIDRWPLLYENIFGEGFVLHTDYVLRDANQKRPVLVRYTHWGYYGIEIAIVLLLALGLLAGRKNPLLMTVLCMFLFDMTLHVALRFASADAYIMTAHWAFIVPMAVAALLQRLDGKPQLRGAVLTMVLLLTMFMWTHNLYYAACYITGL